MRAIVCIALAALAGCETDECSGPATDLNVSTVDGSDYADSSSNPSGPYPTAVGGTQRFSGEKATFCDDIGPADTLNVHNENPEIAAVTSNGATFDVVGIARGTAQLDITGDGLRNTSWMKVAPITRVALAAKELAVPAAYLAGTPVAIITLLDADGVLVVDRSLTVTGDIALGDSWSELATASASVGDHPLVLHAGGADWPVTLTVVDHITKIVAVNPAITVPAPGSAQVCFEAYLDTMLVAGAPWQLDFDAHSGRQYRPNCVQIFHANDQPLVETVTAHALGFTATATVTFQ